MKRRMDAYYYSFDETGIEEIDKILWAIACAGKAFHHTDQRSDKAFGTYSDHIGKSPVDWIQNAENEAANKFRDKWWNT